jgi:hypothetical protein
MAIFKRTYMLITVLSLILVFTFTSLFKTYYSWKTSLSGIVLGTAMIIVSILSISLISYNFNLSLFVINVIETGSIIESLKIMQSDDSGSKTITLVFGGISIVGVFFLGLSGIKNYNGPIRQTEWKAKTSNKDSNPILRLLITDILFTFKPNNIVYDAGVNPYKIVPNNKIINWRNLSLDLLTDSNSDISVNKSKWSELHCCFVCEKTNYATGIKSKVFLFPLTSLDSLELTKINYYEIQKVSKIEDEVIFCYEDSDSSLAFDKFAQSQTITSLDKHKLIYNSIDIKTYAKYILKRFEETVAIRYKFIDEDGSESTKEITLDNTFVEPKLYVQGDKQKRTKSFYEIINSWLANSSSPQLAFLGEFGQGKSTILLEYCSRWAKDCLTSKNTKNESLRIPLLIELRGRSPSSFPTPEAMLGDWGQQYGFTGKQLLNLVQSKMAILIFEGFDEVKNAGNKLERYKQFNSLWKYAYQGSKILFTGRPNFFFNEDELYEFLNVDNELASTGQVTSKIYHFDFMGLPEITEVMRNVEPILAKDIISLASTDKSLMDIAKRPSMLPVILSQWQKIKESKNSNEPITPSQIVEGYIKATFLRKEEMALEKGHYQILPWEIRHFITKAIAQFMLIEKSKNTMTSEDIDRVTEKAVKHLNKIYLNKNAPSKLREAVSNLNLNKIENNETDKEISERIASDVRSNGLLAPDPATGSQSFYFPHKQFYEYFLGENFAGFHAKKISAESIAIYKISSYIFNRRINLATLMRLEPMSLIYFSGLLSIDTIKEFEPATSPSWLLKLFTPYINLINILSITFQDIFKPSQNYFFCSLVHKLGGEKKAIIKGYRSRIIDFVEFVFFIFISPTIFFFIFPYAYFFKCSHYESLNIKFVLFKFRCKEPELDKVFGRGYTRVELEEWFKLKFIEVN